MAAVEKKNPEIVITIAIYLSGLGQIDSAAGTIEVDFYMRYRWKDPHVKDLKEDAKPDFKDDKKWWDPQLEVVNRTDLEVVGEAAVIDKEYVVRELRYRGGIRCKMPLHNFPFDTQQIKIEIESLEHNNTVLKFEPWSWSCKEGPASAIPLYSRDILEHPEFMVMQKKSPHSVDIHQYPYSLVGEAKGEDFAKYIYCLTVERRAGYYISKIASIFAMCLICSWSTFFMDPSDIGNRLGIFTTMFLTAVAFQYVVNEKLPNIPYLTKLDHLVNGCYTLLLLSGVEMVIIFQAWNNGLDNDTLFRADMISLALLATPAILLGIWFKLSQLRHEQDHEVKLDKQASVTSLAN